MWGTVASGKTTLAAQLSAITDIANVLHTDDIFYPNNEKSTKGSRLIISEIQDCLDHDSWIIDDNLDEQISRIEIAEQADLVIIFHFAIGFFLKRLILREIGTIINMRKPREISSWRNFMQYKLRTLKLFFESIKIIKNYNQNFVHLLVKIVKDANMFHKTFIIASRRNLEKLVAHLS